MLQLLLSKRGREVLRSVIMEFMTQKKAAEASGRLTDILERFEAYSEC